MELYYGMENQEHMRAGLLYSSSKSEIALQVGTHIYLYSYLRWPDVHLSFRKKCLMIRISFCLLCFTNHVLPYCLCNYDRLLNYSLKLP